MKNYVKIFLSTYEGKYISFLESPLINDFPFACALKLAKKMALSQPGKWIGKVTYLGSDYENSSGYVYIFHCYTREENADDLTVNCNLNNYIIYNKYKDRIPQANKSFNDPLQDKISLNDLILQTTIPEGFSPENINGNGFYKFENNLPTGCFNFQESMKFIGINVYEKDKPRGNHYHYLKVEYTYVLSGQIEAELAMIENEQHEAEIRKITLRQGDMILFLPGFNHKLTAITPLAMAIEVCPQRFNPNDTYRL